MNIHGKAQRAAEDDLANRIKNRLGELTPWIVGDYRLVRVEDVHRLIERERTRGR